MDMRGHLLELDTSSLYVGFVCDACHRHMPDRNIETYAVRSKFGVQVSKRVFGVVVNLRKRYDLDVASGEAYPCSVDIFD